MISTITRKLIAGSILKIVLICAISGLSLWGVRDFLWMQAEVVQNYREAIRNTEAAGFGVEMYAVVTRAEINHGMGVVEARDWRTWKAHAAAVLADVEATASTPEERSTMVRAKADYQRMVEIFETQMLPALAQGPEMASTISGLDAKLQWLSGTLSRSMKRLRDLEVGEANQTNAAFARDGSISTAIFALLSGAAAVLALAIAFGLVRSIVVPLRAMTATMGRLAGGELQVDISDTGRKDEIGEMARALRVFKDHMQEAERLRIRQIEAETQRRESEKLAALGHLAGGVAHEINNLLQPIISLAELAHDDLAEIPEWPLAGETRENLDVVLGSARQAREIVRKILRYARQETPELTPSNLVETVNTALSLVRPLLSPGVTLRTEIAEEIGGLARMHAGEMTQIVTNLAVNADHAMQGQGNLMLAVERTELAAADAERLELVPGAYFLIRVKDTGAGMDQATQARIFDPFFTTKPLGQGTGLGLSMAQGIVKSWNGAITVASAPGQGAEFRVFVPVFHETPAASRRTAA